MRKHSQKFKENIKQFGRELDSIITFGNMELEGSDLNSVTPVVQSSLLKSVMKELDIDSNVEIPVGTVVNYKLGVALNGNDYEYIDYGNYIVYSIEKQEDTNSYNIVCFDRMLNSMVDYEKLQTDIKTFPMTVRDYIDCICADLGLFFKNKNETFANYNRVIEKDLYAELGYTYRDILDELAQVTASNIIINDNDELEVRYIIDTKDTINEEYLKDINVKFGEKYGPINSIVLSRAAESDNVYLKDDESVEANGLCEIKIKENQIMNFNDRSDYLPDILEKLNGLEYYLNDFTSTGVCYYEAADMYNVQIGDETYQCVMFNDEIDVTQGLEEKIFTDLLEQAATDYTKANKTDRKINQTTLIVDKQNQTIEGLVEKVDEIELDTTVTKDASGNPIIVDDAGPYELESMEIEGKSWQETSVQGKNLFDKNNAHIINGYFQNGTENININSALRMLYIECKSNTTYTVSKIQSLKLIVGYTSILPAQLVRVEGIIENNVSTSDPNVRRSTTITTNSTAKYLCVTYYNSLQDTIPEQDVFNSIMIEEGNKATFFEPFIPNSPSPEYPSEIKSVKGVTNYFNKDATPVRNVNISSIATLDNGVRIYLGNNTTGNYSAYFVGKYKDFFGETLYFKTKVQPNISRGASINLWVCDSYSSSGIVNNIELFNIIGSGENFDLSTSYTFNNENYKEKYVLFTLYAKLSTVSSTTSDYTDFKDIMIADKSADYIPYGTWLEQITTGRNLANVPDQIVNGNTVINSPKITVIENRDYVMSYVKSRVQDAPITQNAIWNFRWLYFYDKDGNLLSSESGSTPSLPSNSSIDVEYKFKTPIGTSYIIVRLDNNNGDGNYNTFVWNFMLNEGTEKLPYESYKENTALIDMNKPNECNITSLSSYMFSSGIPTEVSTGIIIKSFDSNNIDFSINSNNYSIVLSNIMQLEPNTQYTIAYDRHNENYTSTRFFIYNISGSTYTINTQNSNSISGYSETAFTTDSSGKIAIAFGCNNNANGGHSIISNIRIYKGYKPYYELSSIGDVKDTFKDGVITERIGKIVLDGSENWQKSGTQRFYAENVVTINRAGGICNYFNFENSFSAWTGDNKIGINNVGTIWVQTEENRFADLATFKNWLSTHKPIIYYILPTSQTHEIDYTPLKLFEGYNYITLNDDLYPNMNINYLVDSKYNATYMSKAQFLLALKQILLQLSEKVGEDEVIAKLNLEIKDGKGILELVGNTVTIKSDYFELDENGKIKAINGEFSGTITGSIIKGNNIEGGLIDGAQLKGSTGEIGGWNIDSDALYKDVQIGSNYYRVYIQSPQQTYNEDSWVFSCQKRQANGSFVGNFIATLGGDVTCRSLRTSQDAMWMYGALEMFSGIPYIDFHWNADNSVDFTTRIIELQPGELTFFKTSGYANCYGGTWTNASSKLVKRNIKSISDEEALALLELKPVSFDYKNGIDTNQRGFIAEDVLKVLPDYVNVPKDYDESNFDDTEDDDGNVDITQPVPGLDYSKFSVPIIRLCQIQQNSINRQEEIINKQQKQIDDLIKRVEELEKGR